MILSNVNSDNMKHVIAIMTMLLAIGLFGAIIFADLDYLYGIGFGICAMLLIYWIYIMYDEE